jgi:hypothetical protein
MMHPTSWVSTGFPGMNLFSLNTRIHGLTVFILLERFTFVNKVQIEGTVLFLL